MKSIISRVYVAVYLNKTYRTFIYVIQLWSLPSFFSVLHFKKANRCWILFLTIFTCLICKKNWLILQSVLNGYNGTVMAYGQTGTGKTYTVGRLGKDDVSERGIMVRALEDIIVNTTPSSDSVEMSFLQVFVWVNLMKFVCISIHFCVLCSRPLHLNLWSYRHAIMQIIASMHTESKGKEKCKNVDLYWC